MAVAFTSHGYDTTSGNPYTEAAWANAHPAIGTAVYGVRSALDWKVIGVPGQDRTVSIAPGSGFGYGVTDKTVANETIQLDTIASGSRWDMIAVRRDWTPTAGVSMFVKVNGGATAVIPGGRNANPGGIDDQPIALVQVTAGQTQPTSIIDLRTWTGNGGGHVAAHDLVRSYLNSVGTRLWIDGVDWIRRLGANDTPEWVDLSGILATVPNGGGTLARSDGTANINAGNTTLRVNIDTNSGASWTSWKGSGIACSTPGTYFISGRLLTSGPAGRYGTLYSYADKADMVGSLTWTEDAPGTAFGGISFSGTFVCPTGPAFWFTTTAYTNECTIRAGSRVQVTRVGKIA